jgi:hypothetical protein
VADVLMRAGRSGGAAPAALALPAAALALPAAAASDGPAVGKEGLLPVIRTWPGDAGGAAGAGATLLQLVDQLLGHVVAGLGGDSVGETGSRAVLQLEDTVGGDGGGEGD